MNSADDVDNGGRFGDNMNGPGLKKDIVSYSDIGMMSLKNRQTWRKNVLQQI